MSMSMTRFVAALALPLVGSPSVLRSRLEALRGPRRTTATLDLDHAPEAQLRDLGILDGRGAPHTPGDPRRW